MPPIELNLPDDVHDLRRAFLSIGRDCWLVGGYVRDLLIGDAPKDLDLCTDATPDEQVALYRSAGLRHVPTGFEHGTVTVVVPSGAYEITSLRRDISHDGRHAVVEYTRDREADLARRDLTVNALSLDMDGRLLDPFGGVEDLRARRMRFVGSADERMREDYLRILRWFRFHGRFSPDRPFDARTAEAVTRNAGGLDRISRERVWSEVSRIVVGPGAVPMMRGLVDLGVSPHIGLPAGSTQAMAEVAAAGGGADPALMMAAYLGYDVGKVEALSQAWRWSRGDAERALFVAGNRGRGMDPERLLAIDGRRVDWVVALLHAEGDRAEALRMPSWPVPGFPVDGRMLAEAGVPKGPGMGALIKDLKERWAASGFAMTGDDLMETVAGQAPSPK